jgi:hypothetical protein
MIKQTGSRWEILQIGEAVVGIANNSVVVEKNALMLLA